MALELIASVTSLDSLHEPVLASVPAGVGWLEIRADRVGDLAPGWLRSRFGGRLLFGLGGRPGGGAAYEADRRRLIAAAEAGADLIELGDPFHRDPEVLAAIAPERRLLSWRGAAADLARQARQLIEQPARLYRLVVESRRAADGLVALELLRTLRRRDIVAYADGERGVFSRVLSPHFGAPAVFGSLSETLASPAHQAETHDCPSIHRLIRDYGLPRVPPIERIFGIVGASTAGSLSPRLHNRAYRRREIAALFCSFCVSEGEFPAFWSDLVAGGVLERLGLRLDGLTISSPHKATASDLAERVDPIAERAWSANLVVRAATRWEAATTDPVGVLAPLARRCITTRGLRAAIVGCGGSGRAIAAALEHAGARVVLINRSERRGRLAADLLGLPLMPMGEFRPEAFDLVVNATPVGRPGEPPPFGPGGLGTHTTLVDLVYAAEPTSLVRAARAGGATVIDGHEVLRAQVAVQFERMTGEPYSPTCLRTVSSRRGEGRAEGAETMVEEG